MQEHNCFSSSITRFSVPQPAGKNYFFIRQAAATGALSGMGSLVQRIEAALGFEALDVATHSRVARQSATTIRLLRSAALSRMGSLA